MAYISNAPPGFTSMPSAAGLGISPVVSLPNIRNVFNTKNFEDQLTRVAILDLPPILAGKTSDNVNQAMGPRLME